MFYEWELPEEGKPYREWCIPAAIVNQGKVRLLTDDESDAIDSSNAWNEYPPDEPEKTFAK